MTSVNSHVQDASMSVDESVDALPEHPDGCTKTCDDMERESPSELLTNFLVDVISSQGSEYSQAPTSGATPLAASQQPSPEFLMSLGIKVRDFAFENTLPAIVPVPRVPRQVQPTPRPLKRLHRDWDDNEGQSNSSPPVRPNLGRTESKKPRSLERTPTEPVQEPVVQHTRTLERITMRRVYSMHTPRSRSTLPTTPRTRFSASPPTSPLTPLPSHFASQESGLVQTTSAFPFVVHVEGPGAIPASQLDSESQPVSLHPVLYTRFSLDPRSSPGCSSAPSPPHNASPPLIGPFLELPSPTKESGVDRQVRRRRSRGAPPASNRYQLRQRPIPSSHVSSLSRCSNQASSASKSLPQRTRRMR